MKTGEQENGNGAPISGSARPVNRAQSLVSTSADDLKSTLVHERNAATLNEARRLAFEGGMKSKVVLIERRIQQIKRGTR